VRLARAALLKAAALLLVLSLTACSAQLLEDFVDVGEFGAPRPCNEATKLFNTFSMQAKRITWKGDRGNTAATVTLDIVITNDKSWPIALSNSGQGVFYTIEFVLRGEKGGSFAPKEATGIVLAREPKQFKEPTRSGPFSKPPHVSRQKTIGDNSRDVNFLIKPGVPEEGKLVFQAPRDKYLLVIERKFTDKPASAQSSDYVAICKISPVDTAALDPEKTARARRQSRS
jgi:hypothetical protein